MYRSFVVLSALLGASSQLCSQVPATSVRLSAAAIDSFVSSHVSTDAFSGVVLVANRSGIVYERVAGMSDRERGTPMNVGTKLQIASTTKLFTQIAIRQLEQSGKLSLGDTVGKFLPDYPNAVVRSRVTIEQLLRHRSGIGSFWNARFMARRAKVRTVTDYMELFQYDSLLFEPGTGEAYSNGGFVVLGAIIERVSDQSYHDYVHDHVFLPAGMSETMPDDRLVTLPNSATGYTTMANGPIAGDTRLAGPGPRPGYATPAGGPQPSPSQRVTAGDSAAPSAGMRLRIRGADGRELSPEEARAAMDRRRDGSSQARRSNADYRAGMSGPAGDHFSTAHDFLKLAMALRSYLLLDSAHTAAVLGARYAAGGEFRANGGGPGVNAELSIYPTGEVIVVLAHYDPPSATDIAEFIRSRITAKPPQ